MLRGVEKYFTVQDVLPKTERICPVFHMLRGVNVQGTFICLKQFKIAIISIGWPKKASILGLYGGIIIYRFHIFPDKCILSINKCDMTCIKCSGLLDYRPSSENLVHVMVKMANLGFQRPFMMRHCNLRLFFGGQCSIHHGN